MNVPNLPSLATQALAKKISKNKGRTPVPQVPTPAFTLATVRTVAGLMVNGDGTLNVTFDQVTIVSITMLNVFVPVNGMTVLVAVFGTQNYALGPYNSPTALDVPAGRCFASTGTAVAPDDLVSFDTVDYVAGGMAFTSALGNSGLVVPVDGVYAFCGQLTITNAAANQLRAFVSVNGQGFGSGFELSYGTQAPDVTAGFQASVVADARAVGAGDVLNLGYVVNNNNVFQIDPNNASNYLAAYLVNRL